MATQARVEGAWTGQWSTEQKEAWKQIFVVQTWRQVRGFAGAVVCETRDFGHQVAGRMKTNAQDVTKKKARRGTGLTIAHAGMKSDVGSQRHQRKWEQKVRTSKNEWKWQRGIVTDL